MAASVRNILTPSRGFLKLCGKRNGLHVPITSTPGIITSIECPKTDSRNYSTTKPAEYKWKLPVLQNRLQTVGFLREIDVFLWHQPHRSAGHSHWHNIRHTKEANDKLRQKEAIRVRQKVRLAIKSGGSTDPEFNKDLQRAFDDGRMHNIPLAAMKEVLKKAKEGTDEGSEIIIEARGFGNCLLIIECFTDKTIRTRQNLQSILKKHGGTILDNGAASHMFDQKGVIYSIIDPEKPLDIDQATELAIEAGAEDVIEGLDEHQRNTLQFHCEPKELHQVKKVLEGLEVQVSDARFEYFPHNQVKLSGDRLNLIVKMLDAVEANEDVIRIYNNVQPEENS